MEIWKILTLSRKSGFQELGKQHELRFLISLKKYW